MPGTMSCMRSLSDEIIVTSPPLAQASLAYVAIRSSASNPSISMQATLKARTASRINGNCGINSSGSGGRLALYLS